MPLAPIYELSITPFFPLQQLQEAQTTTLVYSLPTSPVSMQPVGNRALAGLLSLQILI